MRNFMISYDLNGPMPTHKQMDDHLKALGPAYSYVQGRALGNLRGRVLETVWYVRGPGTALSLCQYVQRILGPEDRLLVAETTAVAWVNLLVDGRQFKAAFEETPKAA